MARYSETERIKYTKISLEDLILSLDRLTRFKYPEARYFRVYSETISRHLVSPKFSKNDLESFAPRTLKTIFEEIWNNSVEQFCQNTPSLIELNSVINEVLKNEIKSVYNITEDTEILIDVQLRIAELFSEIKKLETIPINLKRLLKIDKKYMPIEYRIKHALRFPVEKVVLCEGITEEVLLPAFSKLYGYDFDQNGVKLISAGGKNQVAKLYVKLKEELKIPIFILLDADAIETSKNLSPILREKDEIYLIKHGEFEDIFSLNLIKRTINKRFKNICECTISDFQKNAPMTKILTEFYRYNELGDFQKADFAKELSENLKYKTDLTDELIQIIEQIKNI